MVKIERSFPALASLIERVLREHPETKVKGIDYSEVSVEKSRKINQKAIRRLKPFISGRIC